MLLYPIKLSEAKLHDRIHKMSVKLPMRIADFKRQERERVLQTPYEPEAYICRVSQHIGEGGKLNILSKPGPL
jgi:hypothetical protein